MTLFVLKSTSQSLMWFFLAKQSLRRSQHLPRLSNVSPLSIHAVRFVSGDKNNRSSKDRNFDRKVLIPASKGQLTQKHASGIPKLAARRQKARLSPPPHRQRIGMFEPEDEEEEKREEEWDEKRIVKGKSTASKTLERNQRRLEDNKSRYMMFDDEELGSDYFVPELLDEDKYYWLEEEYENMAQNLDPKDFLNEEGQFEVEYSQADVTRRSMGRTVEDISDLDDDSDTDEAEENEPRRMGGRREAWEDKDPEHEFFYGQNDIMEIVDQDDFEDEPKGRDSTILPLRDHGPTLDSFLEAMIEHPTRFAQLSFQRLHPESRREPKPIYPKGRLQPKPEFVESFARFLYVSGLSPLEVDGEPADLSNPIHRNLLQKSVARLVGVDSERVSPATASSAFVGFDSPQALRQAILNGPSEDVISNPPLVSAFRANATDTPEFARGYEDRILQLSNLPLGHTALSLIQALFPEGSEVGSVYGNLKTTDIYFLTSNDVLVRFTSSEQAASALQSSLLKTQLQLLGNYEVLYFRARRELLHAGFGGPTKIEEMRKMGPRLIVDGDMPTKDFFLSHSRCIQLKNIDPSLSKQDISNAFQPYCARRRDVLGSIEFVEDEAGKATDLAYVGFDSPGEAEAAIQALNGKLILGNRRTTLSLVKDRKIPNLPDSIPDQRPERNLEELLDDLNNWEKYVDPNDLKILADAGVRKIALDEALRSIRFRNASFGPLDMSARSEALEENKLAGEQYQELVRLYIKTLIECLPTREDVGEMYESLHFPDEPIDLGIFEREEQRLSQLEERRANP